MSACTIGRWAVTPVIGSASTVCAHPNSIGNRAAPAAAISVPPPSRNVANASTPSWPNPPDMSAVSPYIPRNWYLSLFWYGCGRDDGAWSAAWRVMFCAAITMTSYFARRSPFFTCSL